MTLLHSKFVAEGPYRIPKPDKAGEVVFQRFFYDAPATLGLGDIIEMGVLPANCRAVDMILDSEDLEASGTTLTLDVGTMSGKVGQPLDEDGNARTCDDEFFDGATTGQAGGIARMSLQTGFNVAPTSDHRSIGVKVATAATEAAAGQLRLLVWYVDGTD